MPPRLWSTMLSVVGVNVIALIVVCADPTVISSRSQSGTERYSHADINYYHQLMFDVNNYQLIVGARDYLLRFGLEKFHDTVEQIYLPADQEKQKLCERKGMKRWQCRNYITVLLPIQNAKQVLICGTNAFSPECEIRQISSLLTIQKPEPAISKSAFSPLWNTTSLLVTQSGDYYYAGPLDFRGIDAAIIKHSPTVASAGSRYTGSAKRSILRTLQSDSKWINADTNFISSFEFEKHVYFLFRESAVEYINCGKKIYSRIGRVCKNDIGGQFYYRENWTSFMKTRLNCSIPGLFPFYFDELQSVHLVESSDDSPTIYATFSTPENSIQGSAVCAYRIDSVLLSFHGQFKRQKDTHSIWESASVSNRDSFECTSNPINTSEPHQSELLNSQYQLMDAAVQPINGRPYIIHTEKQFQFIAVDVIQSKYQNAVEVIFVSTKDGLLMKYVQWPFSTQACLIETIQVIDSSANDSIDTNSDTSGDAILSMKLLKDTQSIYIGTKHEIIRIPVQRCEQYTTRKQCLASGDPYCGWNTMQLTCGTAPSRNPHSLHWLQSNSTQCPNSSDNEWSDWFDCNQLNETLGFKCFCRTKPCHKLLPHECSTNGYEVQVTNCTTHGGWSEWSHWSQCSSTCGTASKVRYRKCSSPAPAYGGRDCYGADKQVTECLHLPECVNISVTETPSHKQPRWSDWSQWEKCSAKCGGGVQLRRRRLEWSDSRQQLQQKDNGCNGCDVEWRLCNSHSCQELKQQSEWTDWLVKNITGDGVVEQRVKFTCKAQMGDTNSVNIQSRIEERFIASQTNSWSICSIDGCNGWQYKWNGDYFIRRQCSSTECIGWSQWTQWSICVKGVQSRSRECDGSMNRCIGHYKEVRYCSDDNSNNDLLSDSQSVLKSASFSNFESNDSSSYSIQILLVWCFISFIIGSTITGVAIYLYITKSDRLQHMRNQRLSLRLFSSSSLKHSTSSNAYVSPQDFKLNHNNQSTLLSPLNNGNISPPAREATIKRSSTIRAKLHSDQNF